MKRIKKKNSTRDLRFSELTSMRKDIYASIILVGRCFDVSTATEM